MKLRALYPFHIYTLAAAMVGFLFLSFAFTTHAQTDGRDATDLAPRLDRATNIRPDAIRSVPAVDRVDRAFFDRRTDNAADGATDSSLRDRINAAQNDREDEANRKREEIKRQLEQRQIDIERKKDEVRKRIEDRKIDLREGALERIKAYIERMEKRFIAAIERLEKLYDRVLSRVEKFEEEGQNMDRARALLSVAETELLEAREAVRIFVNEAHAALEENTENDIRVSFAAIRELLGEAKDSIKSAHAALTEAIRAIKASADTDGNDDGTDS